MFSISFIGSHADPPSPSILFSDLVPGNNYFEKLIIR